MKLYQKKAVTKIQGLIIIIAVLGIAYVGTVYYLTIPPAPVPKPPTPPPTKKMVLNAMDDYDPITLDPDPTISGGVFIHVRCLYETLVRYKIGSTSEVEGVLATSWEVSPDGTEYTFKLRKGVKFHDGTPFNAAAVKSSYERRMAIGKGLGPSIKFWYDRIDIIDDYTVKFKIKPYAAFWAFFCGLMGNWITSPTAVQKHQKSATELAQEWFYDHSAGTGPYMFKEWVKGDHITFVRFPDYWRGWEGKHFDEIVFKYIPEVATMKMMLLKGDIDFCPYLPPEDFAALLANPDIVAREYPVFRVYKTYMMTQRAPLNDVRVRKAIRYAFDYSAAVYKIMKAHAIYPSQGFIMNGMDPWYDPSVPLCEYNVTKAKALLAEAGYPEGKGMRALELWTFGVPYENFLSAELMIDCLAKIGIKVNLHVDTGAMMPEVCNDKNRAPDLCVYRISSTMNDPAYFYDELHSSHVGYYSNRAWYVNPKMDTLFDQAAQEPDIKKRVLLYRQANNLYVEDCPIVNMFQGTYMILYRKELQGVNYNPMYRGMDVYELWKSQ